MECIEDPGTLRGRTLDDLRAALSWDESWREERLRRGSQAGFGWVLRQYDREGLPTGRMIRWHPGGGHHGPDPYWRVTSPGAGRSGAISAVAESGTMDA